MEIVSHWVDCNAYGHVNNAVYYSWFDAAWATLAIERGLWRTPGQTSIGPWVASDREFLAPVGFPKTSDIGVRIGRVGNSSLRYEFGLFAEGAETPSAVGHFTHVYVDAVTRKSVALTAARKAAAAKPLAR